jgi:adenosylmethionine-8-amino-7-oxononanoate aminotransferase
MAESNQLKRDLRHLVMDLRQMKNFCENPLVIAEADGIYLTDINGKRYIDGISGIYVVNIGHGNRHVLEAIRRQQERISFVAPLHAVSDITIRYATRLTEVTPGNLNTIKLLSGGSEATETALKFMRQYFRQKGKPHKYKVISNYKGYHGATLGSLSASGLGGSRKNVFGPFLEGFIHIPPPTCFRCPYGRSHPGCGLLCADMLRTVIENEGSDSVGAFIIEPIGNTGGIVTPPREYFSAIRETCSEYDVLLVFDEIITGMGRTGNWFAAQTFETTPDILCMGKGMGSGYAPLAGTAFSDALYFNAFWGDESENIHFSHGHTFGGNPVSAAAGLAALEVIAANNLIENGKVIGEHLRNRIEKEVGRLGILGEVRGEGCLVGVEFVGNMESKKPFPVGKKFGKKVERRLLEEGLILRCDPDWIALAPPLTTTVSQADEIIDIFVRCLRKEVEHKDK